MMIPPSQNAVRFDWSSKTIVAIDDVPDLVESTVLLLELEGYNAIDAGDSATGLAIAVEHQAHLVLLDYMLPDMSGAEVGRALRDHPAMQRLKIVMCTSISEESVRVFFTGYDAFLRKPVFADALLSTIQTMLEEPAP